MARCMAGAAVGLPAGVLVEQARIEVRFTEAKGALARLYALVNAYERFEGLVGGPGIPKQRD